MTIYTGTYAVYERLASTKMNAMVTAINSHTHDGTYGIKLNFSNIEGTLSDDMFPLNASAVITGDMLVDGTITTTEIANGTVTWNDIDTTSIHLSTDGYAVYA